MNEIRVILMQSHNRHNIIIIPLIGTVATVLKAYRPTWLHEGHKKTYVW